LSLPLSYLSVGEKDETPGLCLWTIVFYYEYKDYYNPCGNNNGKDVEKNRH
jgi:hypothetical protein